MKTEASSRASAPVFIDCFDARVINIIFSLVVFLYLRYTIGDVNKVIIEQFGDFLFIINNLVIFISDNVVRLLSFSMQKGAEGRPKFSWVNGLCRFLQKVLFYCFSPERGASIML